jgi:glycosyltransferase involved in cell wall biosynthesis/intein/homing endonuclease/2-polyprenyl-3-methyl-5-hydroxy-6-metoxy-1,4-benzoquinol methylase
MPFDGNTLATKSLGGSESAAAYFARELARRGHRVSCWTTIDKDIHIDGVNYCSVGKFDQHTPLGERFDHYASHTPMDVLIMQRQPHAFHKRWNAKVCIWQLHDLALYRSAAHMLNGLWQIDAITTVSQWHKEQVKQVWSLSDEIVHVVPNGVDPTLYTASIDKPCISLRGNETQVLNDPRTNAVMQVVLPAKGFKLLYQSRPERGLEHLVRPGGIMDRVRDLPVHLVVCGYDNTMPVMQDLYQRLMAQAAELPNVSIIGALTKAQLAELQRKCDLLIYPTEFDEVSCITAMEAMHAGLPMLTSDCAALPETCKDSGSILVPLKDGKADEDGFVAILRDQFSDASQYPTHLQTLRELQLVAARTRTWADATDGLEALIAKLFATKVLQPAAILRTAIERSDIAFAKWYMERHARELDELDGCENADAITMAAADEISRLYDFASSPESYAAHYAKHQGAYYDGPGEKAIGEDVTRTTRFRGVQQYVIQHCHKTQNISPQVLDYGCAHGHYTIPLAKMFPKGNFQGFDISIRAVQAAAKWAERDNVANVQFTQLTAGILDIAHQFDVILAGEVLEHVIDPWWQLEQFRQALKPGGCLIITTPVGRWEHSGVEAFRTAREHMFHFERADIEDICRNHNVDIAYAPGGHDKSGEAMGSWIWAVWPTEHVFCKPDYERKLRQYAPRETISACLIVRDAEKTLRKCVESFVDWVDEIVICIDPMTSDRTLDVCRQLAGDFPNRPFTYALAECSARRDGFDAARNESIAKASGDWILWCDADEEVYTPWNLHRFARQSMHNGYGFGQVHYSVGPEQVLTTDFPCRFFRNRQSIQFYGCLTPDTEVTTNPGVRKLSEISIGDFVRTHDGSYRKVTKLWSYDTNDELVRLTAIGLPKPLELTKNHELFVIRTKKCHYDHDYNVRCKSICTRVPCPHKFYEHYAPEWVAAEKIEEGDLLLYPMDLAATDVESVRFSDSAAQGRTSGKGAGNAWRLDQDIWTRCHVSVANTQPLTGDLLRLMGYYVSDGYLAEHKLTVTFNVTEEEYADDFGKIVASIGLTAYFERRDNLINARVSCRPLCEWLNGEFGSGAHIKKAPLWLMRLPIERQREYLRGLWRGDGCISGSLIRYTTVNRELAAQVQDLLLRDGIFANYQWGEAASSYSVFARVKRRKFLDWNMPEDGSNVPTQVWADDRYVYHRVKKAETFHYVGKVMDLTVDGNHSYVANRAAVHNCVHEHPEHEMGKAVLHSIVRPEVKFLHCGYIDEEARRKRYQRNLPLLIKDREKYPTRELNKFLWLRDLAQGLMFEQEQMGGGVAPEHIPRAREGIRLMEELVATSQHIRMISDAMPYYTHCVVTSGGGFESEISIKVANPQAPALAVNLSIKGAFHSREFFNRLANRFIEEPTKHYEDRYL